MTAHVTQAKIKAALEDAIAAAAADGWEGGFEIDLRTGAVSRLSKLWQVEDDAARLRRPQAKPKRARSAEKAPHPKGPPIPLACYRIHQRRAPRLFIDPELRAAVFARDGERCRYCGCQDGPFAVDHIHPVSRGGDNSLVNLAVACAACNTSKGANLLFEEWEPPCCYRHTHAKRLPSGGAARQRQCDKCSIVATCGASVSGA